MAYLASRAPILLLLALSHLPSAQSTACVMPTRRPAPAERNYTSPAVEQLLAELVPRFKDPNLGALFFNTLPNTLDTTVYHHTSSPGAEDSFIITGDIPASWHRDSTNQVWPYLRLVKNDSALQSLFRGLIRRQAANVLRAPYANAFNLNDTVWGPHKDDVVFPKTLNSSWVFEAKWESDSLSNVLRLASGYFNATGDTSPFDSTFISAVRLIMQTFREQQLGSDEEDEGAGVKYSFQRAGGDPWEPTDRCELRCVCVCVCVAEVPELDRWNVCGRATRCPSPFHPLQP